MTIVVRVVIRVRNAHIHYTLFVSHGGVVVTVVARNMKNTRFDSGYIDETSCVFYRLSISDMFIIEENDQIFLLKSRRVFC